MAGYQAVHTGGPIKKKKSIISGGIDAKPNPRTSQISEMTGAFYSKKPAKVAPSNTRTNNLIRAQQQKTGKGGIKGATYIGTDTRKLGGQFRGMESAPQKTYQRGRRVYHVWEDATGRHVKSFLRKRKPATLK